MILLSPVTLIRTHMHTTAHLGLERLLGEVEVVDDAGGEEGSELVEHL